MSEEKKLIEAVNSMIKKGYLKVVKIDDIEENPDNPQVMSDAKFNLLVDNINKLGLVEFPQVYKKGDKYILVGGHKRLQAAKYLGYKEIPVVVYDKIKEDEVIAQLVKMNVLRGEIDPIKFTQLYEKMSKKYEDEALMLMWGFVSHEEMKKYIKTVREELPDELKDKFDEVKDEIKTIDDLALILNRLFSEYGDTLEYNFMVFDWGGKEHLWVRCNKNLWKKVQELVKISKERKKDINDLLLDLFNNSNILENEKRKEN